MNHDAATFYATWPDTMRRARSVPGGADIGKAFGPFFKELMKDGALTARQKELIAVGIGVASRCDACIYSHVEKAMKLGASAAEVMEAAGVAVMMGGGPAYTYVTVAAAAVEHLTAGQGAVTPGDAVRH